MTKLDTRTKSYNTMDDHVFIQLKRSAFESGLEMEWRRRGLKTPRWGCWPVCTGSTQVFPEKQGRPWFPRPARCSARPSPAGTTVPFPRETWSHQNDISRALMRSQLALLRGLYCVRRRPQLPQHGLAPLSWPSLRDRASASSAARCCLSVSQLGQEGARYPWLCWGLEPRLAPPLRGCDPAGVALAACCQHPGAEKGAQARLRPDLQAVGPGARGMSRPAQGAPSGRIGERRKES